MTNKNATLTEMMVSTILPRFVISVLASIPFSLVLQEKFKLDVLIYYFMQPHNRSTVVDQA